jgi:cell shape-determining protein MreC
MSVLEAIIVAVIVLGIVFYVWHYYPKWFTSLANTVVTDTNSVINTVKTDVTKTSNTVSLGNIPSSN